MCMKKLLFLVYFGITVVSAETFIPFTKIIDVPVKSELQENLYEIKHISYKCNLDNDIVDDINQNCIAINGEIEFKNAMSNDIYDMVGVYVGSELRGVSRTIYLDSKNQYLSFLQIYSNNIADEDLNKKLFLLIW